MIINELPTYFRTGFEILAELKSDQINVTLRTNEEVCYICDSFFDNCGNVSYNKCWYRRNMG